MNVVDLTRVDLNLLVVLEILLEERNVTQAAQRLGKTQSAVSHALARLREELHDPLLVRVGGKMRPTPRAELLAPEVAGLLRSVRRLWTRRGDSQAASGRTFHIAAPDFIAAVLPTLMQRVQAELPDVRIELWNPERTMFRQLTDGHFDLVLGIRAATPVDGLIARPLPAQRWAVFARRGHPAAQRWSAAEWQRWPHVQVRIGATGYSPVDHAAAARGLKREITLVVPQFTLVPMLLSGTDLLFTVPREAMAPFLRGADLIALESPLALPPVEHIAYFTEQQERDADHARLRQLIYGAFALLVDDGAALSVVPLGQE